MTLVPAWLRQYRAGWLAGDLTAGLIVTVMLIPQSLAYAMLAGLPPQVGLYASILPLVAYAALGSSMTLAVGPVAVASLMTASALQPLALAGSPEYAAMAVQLALISGVMLLAFGVLRLGFLAYFLSHPVISGFITGSAVLIAIGQLQYILGVRIVGAGVMEKLTGLVTSWQHANLPTVVTGVATLVFLLLARRAMAPLLERWGVPASMAGLLAKLAPMVAVVVATAAVAMGRLDQTAGIAVVGAVPQGLPALALVLPDADTLGLLWLPALLIALVGFVESVSVAQSLALQRQQRIVPNRELLGLGAANIA
ncbi:MAG: sodium-independent anion transporter, partial [Rhodoferax sp.]|nr:sodium-independent anion transporter [Rhodoferax sp.]